MKHEVTEACPEPETVECSPEEAACCSAEVGVRFVAEVITYGVEGEEDRKRCKEAVFGTECILEEPSHGSDSKQRAPEIAVVFAFYAEPEKAPEKRID